MGLLRRLRNTVLRRDRLYQRLAEEQEFHLQELERAFRAQGLDPRAARRAAERRFGNAAALRERSLEVDRLPWLDAVLGEIRLGARSLRRRPALSTVAIASLALGIGASTAMWSVVDTVLLHPLALPHAERLVLFAERLHGVPAGANPPRLADWRARLRGVEAVAAFYPDELTLTGRGAPVKLRAQRTFGSGLEVLGVTPFLGRAFTPREEAGDGERVALLGESAWRARFAADPAVVGRVLRLGGEPHVVIGVLRDRLGVPADFDVLVPGPPDMQKATRRSAFLQVVGRLRPGVAIGALAAEVATVTAALAREYPDTDGARTATVVPLAADAVAEARLPALVLLAAVTAVLLIACSNVGGLLLARAVERRREAALRVALGAGRTSLIRLHLLEGMLLALVGGAGGVAVAALSLATLRGVLPADTPRLAAVDIDGRVLLFGLALSLTCGALVGLPPAGRAARRGIAAGLTTGARGGGGRDSARARRFLVAGQVALTATLLVALGLLGKSLWRMRSATLGFEPRGALSMTVRFAWGTPQATLDRFTAVVLDGLAAIPGVRAAGVVDRLPLEGRTQSRALVLEGRTLPPELASAEVSHRMASPGAFAALGVPLLAGELPAAPAPGGGRLAVVNEELARRYFPAGDALGRRVTFDLPGTTAARGWGWFTVVGVVGNARLRLDQRQQQPEIFTLPGASYWPELAFVVRSDGDPTRLAPALRAVAQRADPEQPIDEIAPLESTVRGASSRARVRLWLLLGFAGSALLLATIGIYGILASDVAQRRRELGIRLALGAHPAGLLAQVVRRGTAVATLGLGAGLLLATAGAGLLRGLLFEVQPLDGAVLAGTALVLLAAAAVASYAPARRAARLDPAQTLREE